MRVTMTHDMPVTVDGVNTIETEAGETYTMGDGVAHDLISNGFAHPADGELEPTPAGELEDKDAGAAAETKPERRRRAAKA